MGQKIERLEDLILLFVSPLYSSRYSTAKTTGACVACGSPASTFRDCLAHLEYESSGICEECQERYFKKQAY